MQKQARQSLPVVPSTTGFKAADTPDASAALGKIDDALASPAVDPDEVHLDDYGHRYKVDGDFAIYTCPCGRFDCVASPRRALKRGGR